MHPARHHAVSGTRSQQKDRLCSGQKTRMFQKIHEMLHSCWSTLLAWGADIFGMWQEVDGCLLCGKCFVRYDVKGLS